MSTAVVVATKHGTTAEIGHRLAAQLGPGVVVHDLADGSPDLCGVETIVLGTPVYAGMPHKAMKQYVASADLEGRQVALFVVGMLPSPEQRAQAFANAYPEALRERAVAGDFLTGRFRFDRLSTFERFTVRWVTKTTQDIDAVDDDAITRLADAVRTAPRRSRS